MPLPKLGARFGAPQPAQTEQTQAAQSTPAPTTQPTDKPRFTVKTSAKVDYSNTGAAGLSKPEEIPLEGEYPAYVSKVGTTKEGSLSLTFRIHAEGTREHGQERTFYCAPSAKLPSYVQKKKIGEIVKFFTDSGLPEQQWPAAANGKGRVPPVAELFTVAVEYDGVLVRVPVMLTLKASMEVDRKDPSKAYQRLDSAVMQPGYVVAPLPSFAPAWVPDICNWPSRPGNYDDHIIDAQQAAADYPGLLDAEMIGYPLQ